MQDSLDDYIRICKNEKQEESPKISQETLITLRIKKECNDRALKIVEFLIEGKLHPESFVRCLHYIDQTHYQDVVEERAISKLCGYPICGKKIPEMPKKKYHISVKSNKVYDITDRKNYCSNFCYKASLHIKAQIETSPLWLRRGNDCPVFKLLPSTEGGLPGEELDQGIIRPDKETHFTSISSFTELSLDDIIDREAKKEPKKHTKRKENPHMQSVIEIDEDDESELSEAFSAENEGILPLSDSQKDSFRKDKSSKITEESFNKPPEINSPAKDQLFSNDRTDVNSLSEDPVEHLKQCIKEWFTLETCIYLHGEKLVKDVLSEKKLTELFDNIKVDNLQIEKQLKYAEICRKLHMKELADEKFDKSILKKKLKPMPDYKTLKEESKHLNLKVKSFYSGSPYQNDGKISEVESQSMINSENEKEGPPAIIPLVDNTSQNALRRKVFLNSLGKVIQQLCYFLNTDSSYILSHIRSLVQTFKFQSHNVMFKPAIWNLIGIICMKILSTKDEELNKLLSMKESMDYFQSLTNKFPNFDVVEMDILNTLRNVESFVEKFVA